MDTVELIIFIVAGLLVGALVIGHLLDIPYLDILRETSRPFEPAELPFSMTEKELELAAFEIYDRCALGVVNLTVSYHFNEDDEYQRKDILEKAYKNNRELDDASLVMPNDIKGPAIMTFHCENGILTIQ